jgi:hypothetical protein
MSNDHGSQTTGSGSGRLQARGEHDAGKNNEHDELTKLRAAVAQIRESGGKLTSEFTGI